jgi:release factor glutamine methyltransferase
VSVAPAHKPLELARLAAGYLARHGVPGARLDAELLLAHALGVERIGLYTGFELPVEDALRARYRELVRRRAKERVPLAYLRGVREFWSRPFRVTPEVLIPRPETEVLVEAALALPAQAVLEVGVGAGAIAATLALERPGLSVLASDRSEAALAVAAGNLHALGAAPRVRLLCCDALDAIAGRFDLVLSNPPYVPSAMLASLAPELRHEPRLALDGGPDGLALIGRLAREAPARLAPGGHLAFEFGEGQASAASDLVRAAGACHLEIHKDLAGRPRVLVARF